MADVAYDAILGSGNTLRQIIRSSFNPGTNIITGRASGAPDPSELYGGAAEPTVSLESLDINGILTILSVTAGSGLITSGITVPYNKRANGATFASGSSHYTITCTRGLAVPRSFTASQDGEGAQGTVDVMLLSSDGTNPVADNVNQALAAQAYNAAFTLGEVHADGSEIADVVSVTVDTGIRIATRRYKGLELSDSARTLWNALRRSVLSRRISTR